MLILKWFENPSELSPHQNNHVSQLLATIEKSLRIL